ncbi:hypothetical protein BpHYR1_020009 [Brachionus plicatilis]|uniref:Uncharacterized protein n=1 Tax=Brachionus plicatilis TaxID=10195 RepID=A0A3M7QG01_BRAPC|nr:hypothetical protein BpHYR1_020009 [Brachionus plicatilis]
MRLSMLNKKLELLIATEEAFSRYSVTIIVEISKLSAKLIWCLVIMQALISFDNLELRTEYPFKIPLILITNSSYGFRTKAFNRVFLADYGFSL